MKRLARTGKETGFTLVELMIVIAIIGILASIAIPNFISYRKKAYNTEAVTHGHNLLKAFNSYRTEHKGDFLYDGNTFVAYGYTPSANVSISVAYPTDADSPVFVVYHFKGDKKYFIYPNNSVISVSI
ncbi:MAG: type II secretion system protein [Deltaproteobacteria bacterium]|nr:type II secretion system protein [Deltaproteobacteria bacterium]